ncbi:MAG TPA: tetratricopeptide repeat protein [Terriglobales bacterium]|jgi:Flp pilus assembly protein TadD|nr:tetratricopeptide repeat protein [Terriglobales bacterium]
MLTLREAIMMRRVVVLLTSFVMPCMYAQSGPGLQDRTGSIRVRVTPADARTCNIRATVSLVSTSGAHIAEDLTNSDCEVYFVNVAPRSYHVTVSAAGIENSDSGRFDLDSRRRQDLDINITHTKEAVHGAAGPLVAAVDLNIPEGARKEFDKANQFVAKGNWQKAIERLNKAIAIYPDYAEAYNNLGVVYGRLGDRTRNLEALQKAVSLNDHFAPAYLNLARMAIADRDLVQAEALLDKAVAIEPTNSQMLVLLANTELLNHHYDQALANCRKAHSGAQGPHAVAHYVAARVFEYENRPTDAVAELQTFLSEETPGPRADVARKEMTALQQSSIATQAAR